MNKSLLLDSNFRLDEDVSLCKDNYANLLRFIGNEDEISSENRIKSDMSIQEISEVISDAVIDIIRDQLSKDYK